MAGLSNFYRPKYFMSEDIVLVTLNYRLASFGNFNFNETLLSQLYCRPIGTEFRKRKYKRSCVKFTFCF